MPCFVYCIILFRVPCITIGTLTTKVFLKGIILCSSSVLLLSLECPFYNPKYHNILKCVCYWCSIPLRMNCFLNEPSWPWSDGSWIYNYLCIQCLSPLMLWVPISIRARCTALCDKVCQWLAPGRWFSPDPPVSSTNKTDRHDITEILLKHHQTNNIFFSYFLLFCLLYDIPRLILLLPPYIMANYDVFVFPRYGHTCLYLYSLLYSHP